MFVIATIVLWGIALIILMLNPNEISNRWLALCAFMGGFVGIQSLIDDWIVLYGTNYLSINNISTMQDLGQGVNEISCYFFVPFFMFSLNYSHVGNKLFNGKQLPTMLLVILLPISIQLIRTIIVDRRFLYVFQNMINITYSLIANWLLFWSWLKETVKDVKEDRLAMLVITMPVTLASAILGAGMTTLGYDKAWHYEVWFFLFTLLALTVYAIRKGVMGQKLVVEKIEYTQKGRVVNNGTLMFNHAIKNEMFKIDACSERIKKNYELDDLNELETIKNSTTYLMEMSRIICENTSPLMPKERCFLFQELVEQAFESVYKRYSDRQLSLSIKDCDFSMYADYILMNELLLNLFQNAAEAMTTGGCIYVSCEIKGKWFEINICDEGPGIPHNLAKSIFEPFYTTRGKTQNFGLGLSYCRNIAVSHGGYLDVSEMDCKGACFRLKLPKWRMVEYGRV